MCTFPRVSTAYCLRVCTPELDLGLSPALPLTNSVTWAKLLHLSGPQSHHNVVSIK